MGKEKDVERAAIRALRRDTRYRCGFLPVPGAPHKRGQSAIEIPLYLGEWLVGTIDCKKSWDSTVGPRDGGRFSPKSYNSGWKSIYSALGQVMLHGQAATVLGHRDDRDVYHIMSRRYSKYPALPCAIVIGASAVKGNAPIFSCHGGSDTEQYIRGRLREFNVDLILCWEVEGEPHLYGERAFLERVDEYVADIRAALTDFEEDCSATIALVDWMTVEDRDRESLTNVARGAAFAFDLAAVCLAVEHRTAPSDRESWNTETLQPRFAALAEEDGRTYVERTAISSTSKRREVA